MPEDIDSIEEIIAEISPYYAARKKRKDAVEKGGKGVSEQTIADAQYRLSYNAPAESLEPVYFWLLEFNMQGPTMANVTTKPAGSVEKIYDTFASTVGSGHFGELQQRASIMQQQATKIMGDVNTVIKSILNLIYSLKEFQMRLSHYKLAYSDDSDKREAGLLALKQIWMDSVDIKRGNTSIKALALSGQAPFTMLIDAFMVAVDEKLKDKNGNEIDLNDRLKRLLSPRIAEFNSWKDRSYKELTKRYEIEKTYLKSQVNSLKLYTRWAKPYLKAAEQLMMKDMGRDPNLVNMFSTVFLQLTLMKKTPFDFYGAITNPPIVRDFPESFKHIKLKRKYFSVIFVDFKFRGIPSRIPQGQSAQYAFGGNVEVSMRAYSLNEEEILVLMKRIEDSDFNQAMNLVQGMTDDTLKQIQEDVNEFMKEDDQEVQAENERKSAEQDINPFTALLGISSKAGKDKKKKKVDDKEKEEERLKELNKYLETHDTLRPDDWAEKYARESAAAGAKGPLFTMYDIYKKAHGMAPFPLDSYKVEADFNNFGPPKPII